MTRRLPALDGLRALAVAQVILYHAGVPYLKGDLGVTIFFVLSGFLITWLLIKEWDQAGTISFRAFYRRRTLRIFPAYYAFMLFSLAWDWHNAQPWRWGQVVAAFGYLQNYRNAFTGHEGAVAHAWSLAIEEQFYLLWPLLFVWLARGGMARVRWGLTLAVVAVLLWRSTLFLTGTSAAYVYNAFDTRFDSLAIGCLIAAWGPALRVPRGPLLTVLALFVSRYLMPETYHYTAGFTVDSALAGLLVVQLMRAGWRWLDAPALRYIGAISYPLYLWHQLALGLGNRLTDGPLRLVLGCAIAVVVASGSYYLLERPALRFRAASTGRTPAPERRRLAHPAPRSMERRAAPA